MIDCPRCGGPREALTLAQALEAHTPGTLPAAANVCASCKGVVKDGRLIAEVGRGRNGALELQLLNRPRRRFRWLGYGHFRIERA